MARAASALGIFRVVFHLASIASASAMLGVHFSLAWAGFLLLSATAALLDDCSQIPDSFFAF